MQREIGQCAPYPMDCLLFSRSRGSIVQIGIGACQMITNYQGTSYIFPVLSFLAGAIDKIPSVFRDKIGPALLSMDCDKGHVWRADYDHVVVFATNKSKVDPAFRRKAEAAWVDLTARIDGELSIKKGDKYNGYVSDPLMATARDRMLYALFIGAENTVAVDYAASMVLTGQAWKKLQSAKPETHEDGGENHRAALAISRIAGVLGIDQDLDPAVLKSAFEFEGIHLGDAQGAMTLPDFIGAKTVIDGVEIYPGNQIVIHVDADTMIGFRSDDEIIEGRHDEVFARLYRQFVSEQLETALELSAGDEDINDSVRRLQDFMGQKYGDVAAHFFRRVRRGRVGANAP